MFPRRGLNRCLRECAGWCEHLVEQLVVKIISIGQEHCCWVRHRWVAHDLSDVEQHLETFARALRVPDDTGASISSSQRSDRPFDGTVHCVELVVLGDALNESVALVTEGDVVVYDVEEYRRRKHTPHEHLEFGQIRWGKCYTVDGLPRCVVLEPAAERTHPCLRARGDDVHDGECKKRRDLCSVST